MLQYEILKISFGDKDFGRFSNLTSVALITVYKAFIRPHLNYGDIIYDEPP